MDKQLFQVAGEGVDAVAFRKLRRITVTAHVGNDNAVTVRELATLDAECTFPEAPAMQKHDGRSASCVVEFE